VERVDIIGGGLSGSEAAWQLAERGIPVRLWEMRPALMTPAHHSGLLGELVCSNSLGSDHDSTASGLLVREMEFYNSLVVQAARAARVAAGGALAVDREAFSAFITHRLSNHPQVQIIREEYTELPQERAIIASGPLTSEKLAQSIARQLGVGLLFFFDAAAPVVYGESIDMSKVFRASRYGKGGADYLNCPLERDEYEAFYNALMTAETAPLKDFERKFFEHCLPVEELARRGPKTLTFGPLKPVGLENPRTGRRPWAVVQLRAEDNFGQLWNLVGFQTNLRWSEQKRVFRMLPGLEQAEFARYGVMHRNSFIDSPRVMAGNYRLKNFVNVYIAGQLSGVEGYMESAASGLTAALDLSLRLRGEELKLPPETMLGALADHVTRPTPDFQPMNANFGLLPPGEPLRDKKERRRALAARALANLVRIL